MKYIKLFNERKQAGILYHYTRNLAYLQKMLRFNLLKPMNYGYVSFTRNQSFVFYESWIRLVIDGDKLSDNYKLQPFQFNPSLYAKNGPNHFEDEFEERIKFTNRYEHDNTCCVSNLKKYLLRVEILDKPADEYEEGETNRQEYVTKLRGWHPDVDFVFVKKFGR